MLTCKLVGGNGNWLFQIATTMATALRNGVPYLIPTFSSHQSPHPKMSLERLPKYIQGKDPDISKIIHEDPGFEYKPIEFVNNGCLSGYFQSSLYFDDYREYICWALGFPTNWNHGIVAVHIRLNDYKLKPTKHPIPPIKEYYLEAMKRFPEARKFWIFSDEPELAKEMFRLYDTEGKFVFIKAGEPMADLSVMMQCEHFIIGNSSYSWWGAYGAPNPDKKIISPSYECWFGHGNQNLSTKYIIPEGWEQIKYDIIYPEEA